MIDSWYTICESVNHLSNHRIKCLSGSVISNDKLAFLLSLDFFFLQQRSVPFWSADAHLHYKGLF